MQYLLIEFSAGLTGEAYMEISDGQLIRICDALGNTVELPEKCEYFIKNKQYLNELPNA